MASAIVGVAVVATATGPAIAAAPLRFAPAVNSPTSGIFGPGVGAETTAVADFDGDGRPDVVVTDVATTTPRVLGNLGRGHFAAPRSLPTATGVLSIATGDFNGDGRPDVVGRSLDSVVLWTGNGNGTFRLAQQIPVLGIDQPAIAVGDVDRDGRPDVVTTTTTGFEVLRGTRAGLVAGSRTRAYGVLTDIAIANLDGDGHPDVVLVDATPLAQHVRTFLGRGDGTFAVSISAPTGYGPEAAAVGDLNHDGFDDVVTSDSFSVVGHPPRFSITVLLSNGTGGFAPPKTYTTADGPVSGAIGDLDGDGDRDVVVSGVLGTALAVYTNNGSGVLTRVATPAAAVAPQTPVIADFDGDGHADIAVPGVGQLSVLLNDA